MNVDEDDGCASNVQYHMNWNMVHFITHTHTQTHIHIKNE